jgi:dephospho-CoA kinase
VGGLGVQYHPGKDEAIMIGRLKWVGLTGGIGAGKSTVAAMIRARGVPVIDADRLAREVVAPGQPALAEIAELWPGVVAADGSLDRAAMAARVFADPAARARLEAITHPRIVERGAQHARDLEAGGHRLAFYEAPLIIETGRAKDFDALVLVEASEEQQIARVMARDACTRAEAQARIAAQLPREEKRRAATHVVDNSGDRAATEAQVDRLLDVFAPR